MPSPTERPKPCSPATRVGGSNSDGPPSSATSTAYNLIMTPINFVTFLLSLVLVDLRYALRRKHTHAESTSRLPPWLHTLLYRPYENDRTKANVATDGRWYYHTKQKKLFKMEADEAFRFRNTMLVLLGLLSIGVFAGVWYVTGQLFRRWIPLIPGPR